MNAERLDLYKLYHDEYAASTTPRLIRSLKAGFLTITGKGEPGGAAFTAKAKALYRVAYAIRKAKKAAGQDFTLCKLEALWWGRRESTDFLRLPREQWNWKLMIRMPHYVREKDRLEAMLALMEEGRPAVSEVKLEPFKEGLCVQALHVGPFGEVGETLERMKSYAAGHDLRFHGRYHEIYLSDPRRIPEERRRTILRVPVR